MPAWWFQLFIVTMIWGVGYLIAYPGMGSWKGVLGWTQVNQWEAEVAEANAKYGQKFASYADTPIEQLVNDQKALKMGQRMFANNCAMCHGSDGGGTFGFPNLADGDWLYGGTPAQIKTTIAEGRTAAMPAWGTVVGDQGVVELSNYVAGLSGREVDSELAAAGAEKFGMFCASCHGADGTGNYAFGAPNLADDIWLYGGTLGQIQHTIANGRAGKMPAHKELLSSDKIHLLTNYVYSLSQPASK